ncbi:hypothetical protein HLK59_17755 [Streptomyces sp. S3(2020)]|uniref:hypothetical protein n=1 Tax=Streptomyces sp. S3(2020) TaxID=2732044 RepID=UPI001488ED9A|nr:hypothetical protein [Streptomyces sp. S3(2020)]NNN32173.1 hypothetical protein [Streptomyces sp. S3(2020)]
MSGKNALMGDGWSVVAAGAVSLLGAVVGGLAAIIGTKIGAEKNADAVLQQTMEQARTQRSQWVRGQRAAAYERFLGVWDDYTLARGQFHFERPPTYNNFQRVQELGGRLGTAAFSIRVVGPESVATAAEQVLRDVTAMRISEDVQAEWDSVLIQYRETNDPQVQQRLVGIAEEILYRGSWDQAIDVLAQRQRFLQSAAEALDGP